MCHARRFNTHGKLAVREDAAARANVGNGSKADIRTPAVAPPAIHMDGKNDAMLRLSTAAPECFGIPTTYDQEERGCGC